MKAYSFPLLTLLLVAIVTQAPSLTREQPNEQGRAGVHEEPIQIGVSAEIVHTFHESLFRLKSKLDSFGEGSSSIALLSFYLRHLEVCIDDILDAYEQHCRAEGELVASDSRVLIGNKELRSLDQNTDKVNFGYLISSSLGGGSRHSYALIGKWRINFHQLGSISSDPDSVISQFSPAEIFQTVKQLVLDTPDHHQLFC